MEEDKKAVKLSEIEIKKLQDIEEKIQNGVYIMGQIAFEKAILNGRNNEVLENLASFKEEQNQVLQELEKTYGKGKINPQTLEWYSE